MSAVRIRVREYIREADSNPYKSRFDGFDPQAAAKVAAATPRLEMGNTSNVKWFEGVGEVRIDWWPGYRIYLAKDGETLIILFGGGTKRRQETDIERAKELHAGYKARKAARKKPQESKPKGPGKQG